MGQGKTPQKKSFLMESLKKCPHALVHNQVVEYVKDGKTIVQDMKYKLPCVVEGPHKVHKASSGKEWK
jgi:hypothetical protein